MKELQRQFDEWMMTEGQKHVAADTMRLHGEYVFPETKILFLCWQAAISSVNIHLPDWDDFERTSEFSAAVKASIERAGVKCYE